MCRGIMKKLLHENFMLIFVLDLGFPFEFSLFMCSSFVFLFLFICGNKYTFLL